MDIDINLTFPITRDWVYLNHALISPLPRPSQLASSKLMTYFSRYGSQSQKMLKRKEKQLYRELSIFFNAPKENILIFNNVTDAILFLRHHLPLKPRSKIIGINMPTAQEQAWTLQESNGITLEKGDLEALPSTSIPERTALVSINPVSEAQMLKLETYSEFLADQNALSLVDLSFFAGVQEIYPTKKGFDISLIETHRWMLGLPDLTIMCVSDKAARALKLPRPSGPNEFFAALHNLHNMREKNLQQPKSKFRDIFFDNDGSFSSKIALLESLKLLNETGLPTIRDRVNSIHLQTTNGLREEGFFIALDTPPGLIIANHEKFSAQEIREELLTHGIIVGEKENSLWISPHFYNTEIDIERFLNATHTIVSQ